MMPATLPLYLLRVKSALKYEEDDDQLSQAEAEKCQVNFLLGVEPGECAAKIIMARAESICGREASCAN